MKIVFVNDLVHAYATRSASAVGGAERQQWLIARALAAAGWQVVVGVRQPLAYRERARIDKVEFVGIGQRQFLWDWYRFLVYERPDWWYWRCASHLLGLAVVVAKLAHVRMIFAVAFDTDVNIRRALYARERWWPLYGLGLLCVDRIFVQNETQFLGLPERLRAKAFKIPSITPEPEPARPHAERSPYVAWVAVLRKFKRPDLLIDLARKAPDVRFVVCGGPTPFTAAPGYGEEIARILHELPNVDYRGRVSSEEAEEVIRDAALFLCTSDGEGFPNTFLQAWSAGTPVVSLSIDPDGVIERHGLGKVPSTVERTILEMRSLIKAPEERDAIASRARSYVTRSHGPVAAVRSFEFAIQGLVPEKALPATNSKVVRH